MKVHIIQEVTDGTPAFPHIIADGQAAREAFDHLRAVNECDGQAVADDGDGQYLHAWSFANDGYELFLYSDVEVK